MAQIKNKTKEHHTVKRRFLKNKETDEEIRNEGIME